MKHLHDCSKNCACLPFSGSSSLAGRFLRGCFVDSDQQYQSNHEILLAAPVPQRSIDMQAIQPDYAQGSPRGGHEYFPGKKFLEEVTTDPSNGRCNCTKQFAVLMDWIVAVQKIKRTSLKNFLSGISKCTRISP